MHLKLLFKQVVQLYKFFCRITTHNLLQNNIITPNYVYYKIIQLTHENEYYRALFFLKTQVRCIKNCYLGKLCFSIFFSS